MAYYEMEGEVAVIAVIEPIGQIFESGPSPTGARSVMNWVQATSDAIAKRRSPVPPSLVEFLEKSTATEPLA